MEQTNDTGSWKEEAVALIYGFPSRKMLLSMTDKELLAQINYDVADGRYTTLYSQEYDRRRALRNAGKPVPILARQPHRKLGWLACVAIPLICAAIALWIKE